MTTAAPAAPALESPSIKRQALLSLALALAVGTAILLLPALEPVRDRFEGTNGVWVAAALGLQVLSTLSFVVAFRGAFERRIGWRAAFDLSMVEEGTNVILPSGGSGGLAVGAVLLIRAGVPTRFAVSRSGGALPRDQRGQPAGALHRRDGGGDRHPARRRLARRSPSVRRSARRW